MPRLMEAPAVQADSIFRHGYGRYLWRYFRRLFGGGRRNSNNNGPAQGASVRLTVRITFEEAVFGCSKELEFPYKEECKTCHGTGAKPGTSPETCSKCGGKGKVVYSQQSLFGMMQNVQTCPDCGGTGKVIRENVRIAGERDISQRKYERL